MNKEIKKLKNKINEHLSNLKPEKKKEILLNLKKLSTPLYQILIGVGNDISSFREHLQSQFKNDRKIKQKIKFVSEASLKHLLSTFNK